MGVLVHGSAHTWGCSYMEVLIHGGAHTWGCSEIPAHAVERMLTCKSLINKD